ncbi:hypothetical protein [Methylosinus sp. Sm6]|uniref:hypothetical protein n=1 Tax=Methylosinus sp. Sm6 TaxID=2866948 RepID=UPI001C998B49|nr:hypothetical protein [Methylosinus sp. Sm6]MBY6243884.1 hypothetical protein [Methylosinus sp. Sm6]
MRNEEDVMIDERPLEIGARARFTGDDLLEERDRVEIVGTIKNIKDGHAALRDDAGNLWCVSLDWLERVETTGEAA